MIQASLKTLMLIAVVAITSNSGRLLADAPEIVIPTITEQAALNQNHLQQVSHQTDGNIQQVQCVTESCESRGHRGSCNNCGKCKKCRSHGHKCKTCKPSMWDRVKAKFGRHGRCDDYCEFNVHCPQCRGLGRNCGRCGHNGGHNGSGKNRWWLPSGCGGKGCPPFGMYQMVYPVNPQHCDNRDRNVHAAQGYNMPMSVPLAPVVRHQYNYSWGVPSSRLTPISNYAPGGLNGYGHHGQMPSGYCPSCQPGSSY